MLSIDEFAKKCKVSKATVSRAFRENSGISRETKDFILARAQELHYKPKAYTKRVQPTAHSSMIGIMLGIKPYPYANDLCMAISEVVEAAGYVPVIFNNQNGDMSEVKALNAAKNILSGLIIVPATTQNEYNSKFIKQISKKMPVMCIIRKLNDVTLDSITIKNYSGLLNATRLLLDHGHKNIGFFTGPMNIAPSHDKLTGYTDALNRYNVPVNGDYIVYGEHDIKKTAAQVKELLFKHPEITALITSNIIIIVWFSISIGIYCNILIYKAFRTVFMTKIQ